MTAVGLGDGPRPLRGNTPLALEPAGQAWRVRAGRAQVFAMVRGAANDAPAGALRAPAVERLPLFGLEEGEWAFPAPAALGGAVALELVALEDGTELDAMGRPWLAGTIAAGPPAAIDVAAVRHAVETWSERLAEAVEEPAPSSGDPLPAEGTATLSEGDVTWAAVRTAWIASPPGEGALALFGSTGIVVPEGCRAVPLPAAAWFRATRSCAIEVLPGTDVFGDTDWWLGLQVFAAAALERVGERAGERERLAFEAISRRVAGGTELRGRTYARLAQVISGDPFATPELAGTLPPAMLLVARASGVVLRAPERAAAPGEDLVAAAARASGVRWRRVTLDGRWWRRSVGPVLARSAETGAFVAVLPRRFGGMALVEPEAGTARRVDAGVASRIEPDATVFYRALPLRRVSGGEVLRFAWRAARAHLVRLGILALGVGAVSLVTPIVTKAIFSTIVPEREISLLVWLASLLVVLALGSFVFTMVQQLAIARASGAVTGELQSALWDRVLDLPLSFFRRFTAGALANRVMAIDRIQQLATTVVASSVLAVPVGLFNLGLAFWLNSRMALFGLAMLCVTVVAIVVLTRPQLRHVAAMTEASQESFGVAMQLVGGIGKLRVANAEDRAFAQWGVRFAATKAAFVAAQSGFAGVTTFTAAGTALGVLAMFLGAATLAKGSLSGSTFIAFNTAFSQAVSATIGLTGIATFLAQSRPLYESAQPVLDAEREVTAVRADAGELTGAVDVAHVTFRYSADGPAVLRDVSFSVEPGEFVAIVGSSGAGKSSLMRILLGFEQPEVGNVRYDGKDLDGLDVRSVRRQIGVVTQSVRLLPGDILTNIVGTRPLSMDDAWAAAEIAGIAEAIRAMPMQMHTFVSEGATTFSGGQRQQLLIARAVAGRPKILLFDEATSALDNNSQAEIAEAISRLRAARIVIAHRLSTVRHADKILVLGDGEIVQAGSYDSLVAGEGTFATFARRQLA